MISSRLSSGVKGQSTRSKERETLSLQVRTAACTITQILVQLISFKLHDFISNAIPRQRLQNVTPSSFNISGPSSIIKWSQSLSSTKLTKDMLTLVCYTHNEYLLSTKAETCYIANMGGIWLSNVYSSRHITDFQEIFVHVQGA